MVAREKKILAKRFADAISEHCRDLEHAYVYWIWLRGSASYLTIRPVARKGYGSIAYEAKPNGLLTRGPWGRRV